MSGEAAFASCSHPHLMIDSAEPEGKEQPKWSKDTFPTSRAEARLKCCQGPFGLEKMQLRLDMTEVYKMMPVYRERIGRSFKPPSREIAQW